MRASRRLRVSAVVLIALAALVAGGSASADDSDVALEGQLVTVHSDDFAHGRADFAYRLETEQGTFELQFEDKSRELPW